MHTSTQAAARWEVMSIRYSLASAAARSAPLLRWWLLVLLPSRGDREKRRRTLRSRAQASFRGGGRLPAGPAQVRHSFLSSHAKLNRTCNIDAYMHEGACKADEMLLETVHECTAISLR